jgi:hypothetical protein
MICLALYKPDPTGVPGHPVTNHLAPDHLQANVLENKSQLLVATAVGDIRHEEGN